MFKVTLFKTRRKESKRKAITWTDNNHNAFTQSSTW